MAKEASASRCVTGIEGLDNIVGGGIPVSSIVLVCGGTGTGKTALAVEFLARGVAQNEVGLMISDVGSEEDLLSGLPEFTFLPPDAVKKGAFSVVGPAEVFGEGTEAGLDKAGIEKASAAVSKVISTAKVQRLVIDGIDRFLGPSGPAFLQAMREPMKKNGCTAIVVASGKPGAPLAAVADGVIVLGDIERGGDFIRTMQVLKMRGTGHSRARYAIDITPCGLLTTPLLKGGV